MLCCIDYPTDEEPSFPSGIFSCRTLNELEMNFCTIFDASPFKCASNLTSLNLTHIILSDETLRDIISYCVSLEKLILSWCYYLMKIEINQNNLKFLELGPLEVEQIDITCGSLSTLVLRSIHSLDGITLYAPNLLHFAHYKDQSGAYCLKGTEIVECSTEYMNSSIQLKQQNFSGNQFENLVRLSVTLNLKEVRQANEDDGLLVAESSQICFPYPDAEFWEREEIPDSVSCHLRRLKVRGFKGNVLELAFVEFIIKNACKLEKLIIKLHGDCSEEGACSTDLLLSVPKASANASVTVLK
ncbi:hypothetical protein IFM89_022966 [Coptis chinensis]|uniref:FBD domain-containing protein n=1 Tax=Coptis chinensis TaxID=261450 RepID=A0A835LEC9_9MAGN|nr:hypothetical protein IFM89_022966 [Coptis chinensis]